MELGGPHRLEEHGLHPELAAAVPVFGLQPPAGDEDHGTSGLLVRTRPPRPSPLARHAEIAQDQVETAGHEDPHGLGTARHGQDVR